MRDATPGGRTSGEQPLERYDGPVTGTVRDRSELCRSRGTSAAPARHARGAGLPSVLVITSPLGGAPHHDIQENPVNTLSRRKVLIPLATVLAAGTIAVGSGATFTSTTGNTASAVTSGTLKHTNSKD